MMISAVRIAGRGPRRAKMGGMCGIAGWVTPTRRLPIAAGAVVAQMTAALTRRGPDDSGSWHGQRAVLGHRRLAVVDPAGGEQPMALDGPSDEPELVLVYSGEVYNNIELRAELELRGHKFRTRSDTEVVLHAVAEWGEAAPARLNGMFAFAAWHPRRRRLLLARDRLGVTPLFVAADPGGGLLFASEPKALLASGRVAAGVDPDGLRDLLAAFRTPGQTLHRGIREVQPGTTVVLDPAGRREHRYWRLAAGEPTRDAPERLRALLVDVVGRHLGADVPLGALLSGGLDSSVLAALGQQARVRRGEPPLRTFSVDFAGHERHFAPDGLRTTPDAPYVAQVAAHCGLDHRDVVLDAGTLGDPDVRAAVVAARDAPALGDLDTSLHLLFRAVRKHATVVLSGESADEVFGGYPWFHAPHRPDDLPWRYFTGRSGTCLALLRADVAAELDVATHRAESYRTARDRVPHLPGETGAQRRLRAASYLHLVHWLPDLLDRKDRLSMAVGLEVRVPFCDHRIVELAFNTPWAVHTAGGRAKALLRDAARGLLPDTVVDRIKAPYPTIVDPDYDALVRNQVRDLLGEPAAPAWDWLDPTAVRARLHRPAGDRATRAGFEFALTLQEWLRGLAAH